MQYINSYILEKLRLDKNTHVQDYNNLPLQKLYGEGYVCDFKDVNFSFENNLSNKEIREFKNKLYKYIDGNSSVYIIEDYANDLFHCDNIIKDFQKAIRTASMGVKISDCPEHVTARVAKIHNYGHKNIITTMRVSDWQYDIAKNYFIIEL